MTVRIFISCHEEEAATLTPLKEALRSHGKFECTENESLADVILLYVTAAYIAPTSGKMREAGRLLDSSKEQRKLAIVLFAGMSVGEVKNQARDPGWPAELEKLTEYTGIDMRGKSWDYAKVTREVERALWAVNQRFDVFLSHAGPDKHEFVVPLKRVLESGTPHYRCFLDEESLHPGTDADPGQAQISAAATTSRLGLFVLSDYSIKKWWPLDEIRLFRAHNVPIFVVWYKFLPEQALQYLKKMPKDMLDELEDLEEVARSFLNDVLNDEIPSIKYSGAWNMPDVNDVKKYSHLIKEKIVALKLISGYN